MIITVMVLFVLACLGWLSFFVMEGAYMDERVARLIAEGQLRATIEEAS